MVDYNNDTTLATPPIDINRIQILERRAYVIEALEKYYKNKNSGVKGQTHIFKSVLCSLFWELQETINRKFPETVETEGKLTIDQMYNILFKDKASQEEVISVWKQLNLMLGEMNLTRVDTKKEYDTTNIEEENRIQNL